MKNVITRELVKNEVREVGGGEVGRRGKFWGREGAKKSLGRGRGCVFGSSTKWFELLHIELVHWWLLVHFNRFVFWRIDSCKLCHPHLSKLISKNIYGS